jgi:hypothetical protein
MDYRLLYEWQIRSIVKADSHCVLPMPCRFVRAMTVAASDKNAAYKAESAQASECARLSFAQARKAETGRVRT